jgi:hypothetical protein
MGAFAERMSRLPKRALDLVLQRRAEARAKAYAPEQHERVRTLHRAALARIIAGRGLRDASDVVAAGTLYREAALLTARAVVAAHDPAPDTELDAKQAWERLDQITTEPREPDTPYARAKRLATDSDVLALDRMPPVRAREDLDQVDRALSRLLGEVEPRTVRRIKVSRVLRILTLAAVKITLLVLLIAWLVAPTNIAKGKPASAISYWPGSGPASELVNGNLESPWGSATGKANDPWFQIDLLDPYELRKVVVINRDDSFASSTVPLVIETSEDGATFSEIARFEGPAVARQRWVHKGGGRARHVRVRRVGAGLGFALSEIEVYGKKL